MLSLQKKYEKNYGDDPTKNRADISSALFNENLKKL